jgi:hypothetical protein
MRWLVPIISCAIIKSMVDLSNGVEAWILWCYFHMHSTINARYLYALQLLECLFCSMFVVRVIPRPTFCDFGSIPLEYCVCLLVRVRLVMLMVTHGFSCWNITLIEINILCYKRINTYYLCFISLVNLVVVPLSFGLLDVLITCIVANLK